MCLAGTARFLILGDGDDDGLEPAGFFQKIPKKKINFSKISKGKTGIILHSKLVKSQVGVGQFTLQMVVARHLACGILKANAIEGIGLSRGRAKAV